MELRCQHKFGIPRDSNFAKNYSRLKRVQTSKDSVTVNSLILQAVLKVSELLIN